MRDFIVWLFLLLGFAYALSWLFRAIIRRLER
jgi:hypothetical protein